MLRSTLLILSLLLPGLSQAQDFTLTDTQGKTHRLSDYQGKWVLVNFWATWCPPCLEEIPDLVALYEAHRERLEVIGIAMEYKDPKAVLEFADGLFMSYPLVLGNNGIAAQVGKVNGLPTTFIFSPAGKQVARHVGAITRESVEQFMGLKNQTPGERAFEPRQKSTLAGSSTAGFP
ncbi:MAG: TlpA family protein disulfide reductase [Burkholderiales bacterium]